LNSKVQITIVGQCDHIVVFIGILERNGVFVGQLTLKHTLHHQLQLVHGQLLVVHGNLYARTFGRRPSTHTLRISLPNRALITVTPVPLPFCVAIGIVSNDYEL
jgi:hypothetical protein